MPPLLATAYGASPLGVIDSAAALQDWIDDCITLDRPGWLPPGSYRHNSDLEINDTVELYGVATKSKLLSYGTTNSINVTAAGYVHIEGIALEAHSSAVNGFVSAYAGATTCYRHEFVRCQTTLFSGEGFGCHNNEHSLWDRCYAYQCGTGFQIDAASRGTPGTGGWNIWRQCRAHECTGNGFDMDDQINFRMEQVESLGCGAPNALIYIRGNTFGGYIDCDVEMFDSTVTKKGLAISGNRHVIGNIQGNWLLTVCELNTSLQCKLLTLRSANVTNQVVYTDTTDARNTVFDSSLTVFDPNPANTGNIQMGNNGWKVLRGTSTTTATIKNEALHEADTTSGGYTVTLPTSAGRRGHKVTIKKVGTSTNTLTIGTTSSQTIDGTTTKTLTSAWQALTVVSDGVNWITV
jgi:hypothetical protein